MEAIRKSPTEAGQVMGNDVDKGTVSVPENKLKTPLSQFPVLDTNYRPAWQAGDVVDVTPSPDTLLDKALIHHAERVPKPDTVLAIEQDGHAIPVWTRGSVSGIIGKAKGGKTGWVVVAVAAVLCGRVDGGNIALTSTATGNVLFFDTEQGRYYGSVTLGRIRQLAPDGIDRLKYYDLREHQPKKRLELIRHAIQQETVPPALVVLDGLRDVVFDINASDEAIIILTDLMAVSVTHDTHIVCVLHQNKGDANARGHLGTELINKAEAIFSVNKSPDDPSASIIEPEQMRGLSPNPMGMGRDGIGTPMLTGSVAVRRDGSPAKPAIPKPDEVEDAVHHRVLLDVFKDGALKPRRGDLETRLANFYAAHFSVDTFGGRRVKSYLDYLLNDLEFIAKNGKDKSPDAYYYLTDYVRTGDVLSTT